MNEEQNILEHLLQQVSEAGMRKTRATIEVLKALVDAKGPVSLNELCAENGPLKAEYEMPTIFRLMTRLEQQGLVQKLGFRDRAAYYTLRLKNRHHDYLICTDCGNIEALEIACPVHELEIDIAKKHGFSEIYHELEFYGKCPSCA